MVSNDEDFYMARIQDVIDGHPFLTNAYLWEHKHGLPQQLFIAEDILALPSIVLGISVPAARTLYTGVLSAGIFLLTYAAFFLVTRSRASALGFTVVLMLGLFMERLLRPVSPQFNIIFFLLAFILLWSAIQGDRSPKRFVIAGAALGFLCYIYPYYWTLYLILYGLLFCYGVWRDRNLARGILISLGSGLIVAIPYIVLTLQAARLPEYESTLTRLGLIYSHIPSGLNVLMWCAIPLVLAGFLWRMRLVARHQGIVLGALALCANMIAVNQHVLTGKNIEFSSHYLPGAIFFSLIMLAYLHANLVITEKRRTLIRSLSVAAGLYAVVHGLYGFGVHVVFAHLNEPSRYTQLFAWLNTHTERDAVILANEELSGYIPAYTHDNVFFARNANLFFLSDREVIDRFLINNYDESVTEDFVRTHERSLYGVRYIDRFGHIQQENKVRALLRMPLLPATRLPDDAISVVMERSRAIHAHSFQQALQPYRVDYVIWDSSEKLSWQRLLTPIEQIGPYTIYKL